MEKKTSDKAPSRLGRGLAALIPPTASASTPAPPSGAVAPAMGAGAAVRPSPTPEGVQEIVLDDIRPNPNQPRTIFNDAAIDELTDSVKRHGVLQPVMVRPRGGGGYELVAGERRYKAALRAGLTRIPAVVRSLTDEESLTVALIENLQREDLNPIEAARAYNQLMDEYGLTQVQLGEQIGKTQSTISNARRLLTLPIDVQNSIADGRLTEAHGRTLLSLEDKTKLLDVWQKVLDLELSVEKTKSLVTRMNSLFPGKTKGGKTKEFDPVRMYWDRIAEQFQVTLSLKTAIKPNKSGGGTLLVEFADSDAIEAVLEKLHGTE